MLGKNIFLFITLIVIFLSAFVGTVNAATTPSFPTCANPEGTIKSSHSTGTHGVAGDQNTYSGSDTVYALSDETLTQCLCATNGTGIQTNWWKISELSEDEISVLVNEGWILIPDGSAWGLDQEAYLAKNINYSCSDGSGGTGRTGGASAENNSGTGGASSSYTSVPYLANTGNIVLVLSIFMLGIIFLITGIAFSKNKR